MIIDEQIEELISDLKSINLENSETADDQQTVHVGGNISLVDDKHYVFSEIRSVPDPQPLFCIDGGNAPSLKYGALIVEWNKVVEVYCPPPPPPPPSSPQVGARVQGEPSRLGPYTFLSLTYVEGGFARTKLYHSNKELDFAPIELEPRKLRGQTYVLAGRARRVMELLFASHIISIRKPRVLLLDGSLGHAFDEAEIKALDTLLEKASEYGVTVAALTKVSSILYRGEPITQHVNRLAEQNGLKHFYTKVGTARRGGKQTYTQLYVVKLNSLAKKPYLLEVYNAGDAVARLMFSLAVNSNNATLPGYPQGLAQADRYARVTAEEANTVKMGLNKHRSEIPLIGEASAHDLLDNW